MSPVLEDQALDEKLKALARNVYRDKRVRSVGIGGNDRNPCFVVVRNSSIELPDVPDDLPSVFGGLDVQYKDTPHEVESYSGFPIVRSLNAGMPEQNDRRPLCIGLEIQNFDDDDRSGIFDQGLMYLGTLGSFVRSGNDTAILSNNHVIAGQNRGQVGTDRIQQAGSGTFLDEKFVAVLSRMVDLRPSPNDVFYPDSRVILNYADAAIATLNTGIGFEQGFHESRSGLPRISSAGKPSKGQAVFKVGRTTGLTRGTVTQYPVISGPCSYSCGWCWFGRTLVMETADGSKFADHGDSGSAIVTETGEIVGLLYAGNGSETYACPIDEVFTAMGLTLA